MLKYFILLLIPTFSWAIPRLDPNKATVCAMTLNSDEERAIFEEQVRRHPERYNPIVELTEYGTADNWYQRACASGIRCDQLLISGHFASGFSGTHDGVRRRLPLMDMEKAGCSNTCEGIMDHPYEVFLMGCNTLATKARDRHTQDSYLRHLVEDGYGRSGAELTTEARYGRSGDDNKTRIERAFNGSRKQLYGFTSTGPAGDTVDPMLRNYFRRTTLHASLERARAARMVGHVDSTNSLLAESLNVTAFDQCSAGANDEKDRRICSLLHTGPRPTVTQRIALIEDALTEDDWIKYLPTINQFLRTATLTPAHRAELRRLGNNRVIGNQVRNLMTTSNYFAVQMEWAKFGTALGFVTEAQVATAVQPTINRMLLSGLTWSEADMICSQQSTLGGRFQLDGTSFPQGPNNSRAIACLRRRAAGAVRSTAAQPAPRRVQTSRDGMRELEEFVRSLPEDN